MLLINVDFVIYFQKLISVKLPIYLFYIKKLTNLGTPYIHFYVNFIIVL